MEGTKQFATERLYTGTYVPQKISDARKVVKNFKEHNMETINQAAQSIRNEIGGQ